jgi:hypothetical protein
MSDRLTELKSLYKQMATSKPDDTYRAEIAKEVVERLMRREEDLMTPHVCNAAYIYHPAGADLDEIEPFTNELTEVVDKMKEELLNEKRLLEGTDVPEYKENELSQSKPTEEEWKNDSLNGCSTTDPTLSSTVESNSLSSFVRLLNLPRITVDLNERYEAQSTDSCSGKLDDSGSETDAMNECSECTVPMISELMLGMPNEEK